MTSDEIIYHDPPPNHQFPANMLHTQFHDPGPGLTGFDPPSHHSMLQQMHMWGNFPPPHLLRGFPRNAPMLAQPNRIAPMPHASNQITESMPEFNPLQAFPLGHRQLNFAGIGLPPPGKALTHMIFLVSTGFSSLKMNNHLYIYKKKMLATASHAYFNWSVIVFMTKVSCVIKLCSTWFTITQGCLGLGW